MEGAFPDVCLGNSPVTYDKPTANIIGLPRKHSIGEGDVKVIDHVEPPTKTKPDPKTQASFVFFSSAKVLREFRETFAEEFCNFGGIAKFFES